MLNVGLTLWKLLTDVSQEDGRTTDLQTIFKSNDFRHNAVKDLKLSFLFLVCCSLFIFSIHAWIVITCLSLGILVLSYWLQRLFQAESYEYSGKTILITGCDTGFGNLLARHLAQNGATVFAGCLNHSGDGARSLINENRPGLHVLQLDVTDTHQVEQCVKYVDRVTEGKGLWGVVNNAGLNFLGDIELTTMEQFQRVTDINMLGMVRVTKALLPLVRRQRGRIVNVASIKGRLAMPLNAAYTMSKHAVEAFSDILRLECNKFGIKVSIIEPGNFGGATGCLNMSRLRVDFEEMWEALSDDARRLYGRGYLDQHVARCVKAIPTACFDLMRVVRGMEHALLSDRPNTRYLIAGGSGFLDICTWRVRLNQILPTGLMDRWLLGDVASFKLANQ